MTQPIVFVDRSLIQIDPDVQPREKIDQATVDQYREDKQRGDEFPPAILFFDGERYWPGDGIHRILAEPEGNKIPAIVKGGGRHEARLYACGANRTHGLKRSNADKRRAVKMALEEMSDKSDGAIAKHVGVSQPFVGIVRASTQNVLSCESATHTDEQEEQSHVYDESESQIEPEPPPQVDRRTGLDGRTRAVPPRNPLPTPEQTRFQQPKQQSAVEREPGIEEEPPPRQPSTNGKPTFDDRKIDDAFRKLSVLLNERATTLKQQRAPEWKTVREQMDALLEAWEAWHKEKAS